MKQHTVIPAIRNLTDLPRALSAPSEVVFLLDGEIIQLRQIVQRVKAVGKDIYIHLDLIKGIKEDDSSIHFLAEELRIDGIISTRASSLLCARKYHLDTVQRGFLIDSQSQKTIVKSAKTAQPDYIELMPSFSHVKLDEIKAQTQADIILGGFVETEQDIERLFASAATAVSTSESHLWTYRPA